MLHLKNIGDGHRYVEYLDVYLSAPGEERIYIGRVVAGVDIPRNGEVTLVVRLPEDVEPGDYYYFILVADNGEEIYSSSFSVSRGLDIVSILLIVSVAVGVALLVTRLR